MVLENSLESYHIPMVHAKSFGVMPKAEACWHVLDERYTTFRTQLEDNWVNRNQAWLVRRMGAPVSNFYEHQNVHPGASEQIAEHQPPRFIEQQHHGRGGDQSGVQRRGEREEDDLAHRRPSPGRR